MLIAQVIKRGWYIDYKVRSIDDIPLRYILHIKTIGYEKHGTDCVSYVIVRLQGMEPPHLRGSRWVSKFKQRKGKGSDRGDRGGTHGSALRFIGVQVLGLLSDEGIWYDGEPGFIISWYHRDPKQKKVYRW